VRALIVIVSAVVPLESNLFTFRYQGSVLIEQKGMTENHDFGYSFPFFSSLLKKEGRRKGE
jgi:hypothetical protein